MVMTVKIFQTAETENIRCFTRIALLLRKAILIVIQERCFQNNNFVQFSRKSQENS